MRNLPLLIFVFASFVGVHAQSKEPAQIDEFGSVTCEDYLARMDNVIIVAKNNPDSQIYVLVYEGKAKRYVYDSRGKSSIRVSNPEVGLAKAKIRSMKKYLAVRNFPQQNFVFVIAGRRENFAVEIFFVPKGADEPVPTMTLSEIRYRKGKPQGFCLGCCG